jgi:hypothetical protein
MPSRVTFSKEHPDIQELALYYNDVGKSLRLYFGPHSPSYQLRFEGYSRVQVETELNERLAELEMGCALAVLSAIEGAFRIDYLQRCYLRKRDLVSKAFQALHREREARVSLEDEILEIWKQHTGASALIGNLRGAFKFRHWLAHGRYWVPRFPTYDYLTIYSLADNVLRSFPLLGPDA